MLTKNKKKVNMIGHTKRKNCTLKHVTKINKERRGDDGKDVGIFWIWKTRFGMYARIAAEWLFLSLKNMLQNSGYVFRIYLNSLHSK
jgi:hypothetical protein